MRYLLPLLLLLGGCGGCASIPSHSELRSMTVRLKFADGSICSGTAIAADTLVTASHCGASLATVNERRVKVTGVGRDKRDMMTLRVSGVRFAHWARWGKPVTQGARVRWFGTPNGVAMYREGYVTLANTDIVLIDAPAFGGDSGAGIWDERGELVGVLTGGLLWDRQGHHMQLVVMYPPER